MEIGSISSYIAIALLAAFVIAPLIWFGSTRSDSVPRQKKKHTG